MTGGNQLLLSTTLGGTPIAQLIRRLNAKALVWRGLLQELHLYRGL